MVFFYLDHNTSLKGLLSSLLRQLLSHIEYVPGSVESMYDVFLARGKTPDYSTLLREFLSCASHFKTVYVLIDALDECAEESRKVILEFFRDILTHETVKFKVLGSSRPHLRHIVSLPNSTQFMIDAADIESDVQTYITSKLSSNRRLPQHLKDKILKTIPDRASGM